MSAHSTSKPIDNSHINAARLAANNFRNEDFDGLSDKARTAIDNCIGKLSNCSDVNHLAEVAHKQFTNINTTFVPLGYGVKAKFMALDMVRAYTDAVYKGVGIIKPYSPKR